MRIYEFAKDLGISSKEAMDTLKKAGFDFGSHMAVLTPDAINVLKKHYAPKEKEKRVLVETTKKEQHKNVAKTQIVKATEAQRGVKTSPYVVVEEKAPVAVEAAVNERGPQLKYYSSQPVPQEPLVIEAEEQEKLSAIKGHEKIVRFIPGGGIKRSRRRAARRRRFKEAQQVEDLKKGVASEIIIDNNKPLFAVAESMNKPSGDLILALLRKGMVCNRNYVLSPELIKYLAEQFGLSFSYKEQTVNVGLVGEGAAKPKPEVSKGDPRWPIVVVMGHVDHGKTTLLDYIRKMNVAASEKGGITQHIRAYEVESTHGKIVFLDTPGHEAFSYMRQRGASITDIAVLVVAADDGVKPQTLEAIKHAREANVPIIVALNKVDKVQSSVALDTVKQQLSKQNLLPEDWGGSTIVVPISAKTGQGVNELLEMIGLQAQLMDLRAEVNKPARAYVIESRMERGLGPVSTAICTEGTLKLGDYFTCGGVTGKVRSLTNSFGKKITQALPSIPVQISGFDDFASGGDWLDVVSLDVYLKTKSNRHVEAAVPQEVAATSVTTKLQTAGEAPKKFINLIIKADTRGSKEAVIGSIEKLLKQNKEIKCPIYIISSGVGDISENDVELAANTNSYLIGLHIKPEKNAALLAKERGVNLQLYNIIYQLVDSLQELLNKQKEVVMIWKKVGEATVKKIFDIKGVGIVAGCYMRDGVMSRNNKVECWRAGKTVGEGMITNLQRDRKSVKEIHAGYECGFTCDNFQEWQEGDTVLCYTHVKVDA